MQLIQFISVLLLGGTKFFLGIPLAVQYNFSFWETFIFSCIGGVMGVIIFAKFRKVVLKIYYSFYPYYYSVKKKKNFRKIIAVRAVRKYSLLGIAFLTPIIFLIPIGTFIALHFFPNKKKTLPILFVSVLGWSFLLTLIWI